MFKVMRWSAGSANLTLLFFKVHAIGKKKKEDNSTVRAHELSLYSVPHFESRFVEEPRSALEEAISRFRKALEPYAIWFQRFYSKTKPRVDGAIQQGTASCDYLWNSPPEVMRRLSMIGFSGIMGYLLASRSKFKKLVYPVGLMGITSSIYYPQDAFNIALICMEKLYDWGLNVRVMVLDAYKMYFPEGTKPRKA